MSASRKAISYVLKCAVVVCATVGVCLNLFGDSYYMGPIALAYFTIQSNIWIAAVCAVGIVFMSLANVSKEAATAFHRAKLIFTVAITLTGVVFCTVLAPFAPDAWNAANLLTHVAVPVCAILDFFVADCMHYKKTDSLLCTVPPLAYLAFATVAYFAQLDFGDGNNYPYFFLNWGSPAGAFGFCKESPHMGVVYWIILLYAFVCGVALLYIFLAGLPEKRKNKNRS